MAAQETSYALSDLVKRRRAEQRLSLRALADRCIDPDTGIQEVKHAWIERLEKREPVRAPSLRMLRALAAGLDAPLRHVQDAAGAQFLGITTVEYGESGRIRALMRRAEVLSEEDLARLVAIAETFPKDPER